MGLCLSFSQLPSLCSIQALSLTRITCSEPPPQDRLFNLQWRATWYMSHVTGSTLLPCLVFLLYGGRRVEVPTRLTQPGSEVVPR